MLNFHDGSWLAVPLIRGVCCIVLAARLGFCVLFLGNFFGKRVKRPPTLADVADLRANDAILVTQFGDLGLIEGLWRIIGPHPEWNAADWPVPLFGRIDIVTPSRATLVEYNERLETVRETSVASKTIENLPDDGVAGYLFVEELLDHLISNKLTHAAFQKTHNPSTVAKTQ